MPPRPAESMIFTVNGKSPETLGFKLPDVKATDSLGAPLFPSKAFFERPDDIVAGQKVTVRLNPDDPMFTQAFGYVAPKGQCILDLDPNECWMVPTSPTDYGFAHQGRTILDDGTVLATANIGGGKGHAPHDMGWKMVPRYYEDTSLQMLAVRYGMDDYGVWAAGVAVASLTWGRALEAVRSATSGDWRWVDELGAWDFMGSCLVSLPGLPIFNSGAKLARVASAQVLEPDRAMIVTFSGGVNLKGDDEVNESNCSCKTAKTANAETPATPPETFTAAQASTMIEEALTARDAQWEAKLTEAVGPVAARLAEFEPIILDSIRA